MSSFHPLDSAANAHPLTPAPAELPFHDKDEDDDAWTPPSLPGETRILPSSGARNGRTNGRGGVSSSGAPLDPLQSHSGTGGGFWNGGGGDNSHGAAAEEESYSRAVNKSGNGFESGSASRNDGAAGRTQREWDRGPAAARGETRTLSSVHTLRLHSYYAPTFCDACSQLLIGIMQQGLQCDVCGMNLHPECRATPCSNDHQCRPPEAVQISAGVDASRFMGVRLKPGYPGGNNGIGAASRGISDAPVEDPLDSDWHQQLVQNNQLWVPDSVAAGCMVCSRPFNLVLRRHHCRRCGTCMCGWCSHTAVSDKVLSVNQVTGAVVRISSGEPVRCCTPCTRVLDEQLAHALQRKGWGARHGTPAALDAVRSRFPGQSSSSRSTPFVAAGGAGYAATLPALAAEKRSSDPPEGYDGGGFAPPSSISHEKATPGRTGAYNGEYEDEGSEGHGGEVGGYDRGTSAAGSGIDIDNPLTRAGQQEQQQQQRPSATPPRWQEEPEPKAGEVPSWLGKSSLGSSRRTPAETPSRSIPSGGNESSPVAEQHPEDYDDVAEHHPEDYEEAGGVWGDEATDWSNSGSVV